MRKSAPVHSESSRLGALPDEFVVTNARVYSMQDTPHVGALQSLEPDADSFRVSGERVVELPATDHSGTSIDLGGRIVLPGFVDCHTHAMFAGDRHDEFAARLAGASYASIAARGGGIRATVAAVKHASDQELLRLTIRRVAQFAREGVTTLEIKSGYGLDPDTELRLLELIGRVARSSPILIEPTCLAAHAVPPDRPRDQYVDDILDRLLPQVAESHLARTIDVYIERLAFDTVEAERIFARARSLGLAVRAHTEQLSHCGGTLAAVRCGALSCDHLEYATAEDAQAMAQAGTIAVLLPGAYYCLRETQPPPIAALRAAGTRMAVASDFNPGTSPVGSLLVSLHLAVVLFGLSPAEAIAGVTCNAAAALGRQTEIGDLAPGKLANFTVWDLPAPEHLAYQLGGLQPDDVIVRGRTI